MAYTFGILLALQSLLLQCHASPRFGARNAHRQPTPQPALDTVHENANLRRVDYPTCTFGCAVCAMYAPCPTCTLSLSTPAGIECCTSLLADQSACPTGPVPTESTIFLYTLGILTLGGNPTSLVIGTDTLTAGATPVTESGLTLSIPTTAGTYTGGNIIEDGTTTTLGAPISTITGTGTGATSTTSTSATFTSGSASGSSTSGGSSTPASSTISAAASTVSCYHAADPQNTCTAIADGPGWCECGTDAATYAVMPSPAISPCGWTTLPPTTSFNCAASTGSGSVGGGGTGSASSTGSGSSTGASGSSTGASGSSTGATGSSTGAAGSGAGASGSTTSASTSSGSSGTNTASGTGATQTGSTTAPALSTYTVDGITLTGNPTSLVAGTVTLTPGGPLLTSSGHTIAIPPSATGGQIQVDGSTTVLPSANSATGSASATSTGAGASTTAAPLLIYTVDGIPLTGNPTSLVAGTVTLTPGGAPLTSSGHTIAIPTGASAGQIQVDGSSTALPSPNTASVTGSGTNTGTITGTATNTGTITGTSSAQSFYIATNVPSGIPWGVMLTTASGSTYTLTWEGSKINTPTTIIETGPSTTETTSQTAGGFIWTLPTPPVGFPFPIVGPPPGFPVPVIGGIDPDVPGCIFGCGGGGGGGGGGGWPCIIGCGGGGGGGGGGGNLDPSPSDQQPSASNSQQSNSQSSTGSSSGSSSSSSCSATAVPSCTQVVSIGSSTTITSQSCTTITACSATATTAASTTSSSAPGDLCSIGCAGCGASATGVSKRNKPPLVIKGRLPTPEDYARDDLAERGLLSIPEDYMHDGLWNRGYLPLPTDSDFPTINNFITELVRPSYPGAKPCPVPIGNPYSTAITVAFDSPPDNGNYFPSLVGLQGCTSVVIIGEKGCWISHFWEVPYFYGYATNPTAFQSNVIAPLENGGGGGNMPSPFAAGGQTARIPELAAGATGYQPEIYIFTKADGSGNIVYPDAINDIIKSLTGKGRAFAGITPRPTIGYQYQSPDSASANGKLLVQYTNVQETDMGDPINCATPAIYKLWFQGGPQPVSTHDWVPTGNQVAGGTGNKRRQACAISSQSGSASSSATGSASGSASGFASASASASGSGAGTGTGAGTASGSATTTSSGFTASVTSGSNTITTGPTKTSSSASQTSAFTLQCYPFSDPDAGPAPPQCQCDGLNGFYPTISSTSGMTSYNQCGYTTSPTPAAATSVPGFTTTESDGAVVSCATSTYYNYAVNTIPTCAGSTQIVATITSIASAYSASSASAASWSSAAAVPSAACWILADDGFGDSAFEVYGINGWAGNGGMNLWNQENGCGIVSDGEFYPECGQMEFDGQLRDTQCAYFGLSFFKGGCVERAVHSAGGPAPGTGPGQIACQHKDSGSLTSDELDATNRIAGPQLKAVQAAANNTSTTGGTTVGGGTLREHAVDTSGTSNADLASLAAAALPALSAAAAKASTNAPAPTGS